MPRLLLIFALVALPRLLLAEPAPAPIYVTVRLAPECQGASDFAQQLLSRTHRLRWANPGEPGIVFDVAAGPLQGAFIGQLQIRELDGRYTQRSVEGKTCDGVVNALAFVAAVLADPEAAQSTKPTQGELPPPSPPAGNAPSAFTLGIGVTTGVTTATSNALLQPNVGLRAALAWERRGFSPWITVGLDQRFDSTTRSTFNAGQSIDSTFGGWTAHAALSPIRWPGEGHYFLRPAWLFEVGQLTSSPSNPQNVSPNPAQSKMWLASGAGISAEARIVAPLAAVADLGLLFPISKLQYSYKTATGDRDPFDVPSVGLSGRLGLIIKFE